MEEIIRVAPFRLQLERSPKSARVLGIADAGPQIAITGASTLLLLLLLLGRLGAADCDYG